jgi:hypothetical protein
VASAISRNWLSRYSARACCGHDLAVAGLVEAVYQATAEARQALHLGGDERGQPIDRIGVLQAGQENAGERVDRRLVALARPGWLELVEEVPLRAVGRDVPAVFAQPPGAERHRRGT